MNELAIPSQLWTVTVPFRSGLRVPSTESLYFSALRKWSGPVGVPARVAVVHSAALHRDCHGRILTLINASTLDWSLQPQRASHDREPAEHAEGHEGP